MSLTLPCCIAAAAVQSHPFWLSIERLGSPAPGQNNDTISATSGCMLKGSSMPLHESKLMDGQSLVMKGSGSAAGGRTRVQGIGAWKEGSCFAGSSCCHLLPGQHYSCPQGSTTGLYSQNLLKAGLSCW